MEDIFNLRGNVAFITGGNGGIGKGIADALASKGSDVVIAARNPDKTAEAVKDIKDRYGVKALGVQLDVAQEPSVQAAVKKALAEFGKITILVNDAGVNIRKLPEEYTVEEWDYIMNTNLRGAFLCCKAIYPSMKAAGGGKIINIGSMTSLFGLGRVAVYGCSKMGILSLTYSLALAWAADNIQVNAILPGWIKTPLTANIQKAFPNIEQFIRERVPAGRWGRPADFTGVAIFLASHASDFVTAEYIKVDGGFAQAGNTPTPFNSYNQ